MSRKLFFKAMLLPFTAAIAISAVASTAEAHAHLLASMPGSNAIVPAPARIALKFSEAPLAKFSGIVVLDAPGHSVAVTRLKSADAKALTFAPNSQLKAGVYTVRWHAVTADTHRTQGAFTFTVR